MDAKPLIFAIAAAALLLSTACSTNPVTGKRELSLVSEAQELALGGQTHRQVIEEFGVYEEKPEINQLVADIGRRLAAVSDRPNLPWRFTVLDTPMVNAMALPGGYVYVTRGIIERMNSEDELAGVIAHEVSHVTARHAVQRMSQAQLAQFGLMVGSAIAGPAASQAYGSLAELGAVLLFQRYSRQQETQADLLGTAYMTEVGFNPVGARNMLMALQRLDRGDDSALERYFVDHPDPAKRVGDVEAQITKLKTAAPSIGATEPARDPFVNRLEGMITGNSTLETTVRNNVIYQRRYGMIVNVPEGWHASIAPGTLFVVAPPKKQAQDEALVVQEVPLRQLGGFSNIETAVRNRIQQMGLRYVASASTSTGTGENLTLDLWTGQTSRGTVGVETTQFTSGDNAVVMMQISPRVTRTDSPLQRVVREMRFDRERARAAEPAVIKVGRSRAGESWEAVAERATGRPEDAEIVAEMNGFDKGSGVPAGILLKLPEEVIPEVE